jgi:hypothetical protein
LLRILLWIRLLGVLLLRIWLLILLLLHRRHRKTYRESHRRRRFTDDHVLRAKLLKEIDRVSPQEHQQRQRDHAVQIRQRADAAGHHRQDHHRDPYCDVRMICMPRNIAKFSTLPRRTFWRNSCHAGSTVVPRRT